MLLVATTVFVYYTVWALFLVRFLNSTSSFFNSFVCQAGILLCRSKLSLLAAFLGPAIIPPLCVPRSRMGRPAPCRPAALRGHRDRTILRKSHHGRSKKTGSSGQEGLSVVLAGMGME
jgi:hypothetical protein